jgi:hypothetical protein
MKIASGNLFCQREITRSDFLRAEKHVNGFAADLRHLLRLLIYKRN